MPAGLQVKQEQKTFLTVKSMLLDCWPGRWLAADRIVGKSLSFRLVKEHPILGDAQGSKNTQLVVVFKS